MEIVIILAAVVAVLGYFIWRDRKFEDSGRHPLDGATKVAEVPYKIEPPVLTTKVDGIGHESVAVAAEAPKKAKKPTKAKNTATEKAKPKKAAPKPSKPAKATAKPKKAPKK